MSGNQNRKWEGYGMHIPRAVYGMIYHSSEIVVLILCHKISNPNTNTGLRFRLPLTGLINHEANASYINSICVESAKEFGLPLSEFRFKYI